MSADTKGGLDSIEGNLLEMQATLLYAIIDPFYYAYYGEQIEQALASVASLKTPAPAPTPVTPVTPSAKRKRTPAKA